MKLKRKFKFLADMILPERNVIPIFSTIIEVVEDTRGLEIGGPSPLFQPGDMLPLYPKAKEIDNCNFRDATVWEGELTEGRFFDYSCKRPNGFQYLREATQLAGIADDTYDYLLSSHVLEHCANPLAALQEWKRVVKNKGFMVIILPHYQATADHKRELTSVNHMIADFENHVGEDDLTHLDEIMEKHDLSRDPRAGTKEELYKRGLNNIHNRCLHQHTFDETNFRGLLERAELLIEDLSCFGDFHIVALVRNLK